MLAGAVCVSHSPLMDRNRAEPGAEKRWNDAIEAAATFVSDSAADVCIVFYPDHFNGFLYDLMPSFCVGAGGISMGDFGTVPGIADIPEDLATSCAASCLASGVDIALSYHMTLDHGAVQPIEMLSGEAGPKQFIPIFINCAATPRPSFERVRALGRAVGDWARSRDEKIMMIGSGGLSHDPPVPSVATATGEAARRLRQGGTLSHADRFVRQHRVTSEGVTFSSGTSSLRALNPDWDRAILSAVLEGDLDVLDKADDDAITDEAGSGAHELRCWIAALSALGPSGYSASELFYEPIQEWITAMGVLTAVPR